MENKTCYCGGFGGDNCAEEPKRTQCNTLNGTISGSSVSGGPSSDSTSTTTTGYGGYHAYCASRLPCGYCRLLGSMCPIGWTSPVVTTTWGSPWTVTCHTSDGTGTAV